MSANLPTKIDVKRVQEDTYPEVFSITPIAGIQSAMLEVEGIATSSGAINTSASTISFPVSAPIANAAVGSYDYDLVVTTTSGETRTIVQGKWKVSGRKVT